jgi:hypothetical protein
MGADDSANDITARMDAKREGMAADLTAIQNRLRQLRADNDKLREQLAAGHIAPDAEQEAAG